MTENNTTLNKGGGRVLREKKRKKFDFLESFLCVWRFDAKISNVLINLSEIGLLL